ncbi:MAG: helix-turn-helix transcriptional regulator [Clostridia bacterium]|nr:helix-turn-helix transcriptional regulator [Clostridia bacterium]
MRIRDLREDNDITQKAVAEYLSIRQNTYSQYENGLRQIPIELLIKLSFYYDVSVDYILELTDIKTPYPRKTKRKADR